MVFLLLRVSGLSTSPEELIARHHLKGASAWLKGDPRRSGALHDDSGFSLALEEMDSWPEAMPAVRNLLNSSAVMLRELAKRNAKVELSIGVTVGEQRSFAPSLEFPLAFLEELVALRVLLTITAYPTSDET